MARGRARTMVWRGMKRLVTMLSALVLILICMPLFVAVGLMVLLHSGRPVIYRGQRLGRDKKPFVMYKFRTLAPDAESIIGAELLSSKHMVLSSLGRFLRDTRLDELPQLVNVLKGDMAFLGPRPVRPQIYDQLCRGIRNYDRRFAVRPGLVGYSQLFTPHSAPKKIRALIDNTHLSTSQASDELLLLAFTAAAVVKTVVSRSWRFLRYDFWPRRLLRHYSEKRRTWREPIRVGRVFVEKGSDGSSTWQEAELLNINGEAFLMRGEAGVGTDYTGRFRLEALSRRHGRTRRKTAVCHGKLLRSAPGDNGLSDSVVVYEPVSPLNHYRVHQYFLRESMA